MFETKDPISDSPPTNQRANSFFFPTAGTEINAQSSTSQTGDINLPLISTSVSKMPNEDEAKIILTDIRRLDDENAQLVAQMTKILDRVHQISEKRRVLLNQLDSCRNGQK